MGLLRLTLRLALLVLYYRVFPHLAAAEAGAPGHPLYEHRPQRGGRLDHPDYYVWYLAVHAEAAVGETFGNLAVWDESMFPFPLVPGARRAVGVYSLPDNLRVLDLDDARNLLDRGLRPTQIVERNLSVTSRWAHDIWADRDPHDAARRLWQGVKWCSYHRPSWNLVGVCGAAPRLVRVDDLDLDHPAVREAAQSLLRRL